jgi:hypothetical protein
MDSTVLPQVANPPSLEEDGVEILQEAEPTWTRPFNRPPASSSPPCRSLEVEEIQQALLEGGLYKSVQVGAQMKIKYQ